MNQFTVKSSSCDSTDQHFWPPLLFVSLRFYFLLTLGTHSWIRSFNFSIVDDWRAWHLDGQAAGVAAVLTASGNRPKKCFAMAKRCLDDEPL
ncbi:hypothetical protein BAE44_0004488 [Dichanthelium oligosanthes]|uniref:Uncharacterized protein n=1 Tax=Dichanthelium oligosanthes TaxID=888268 RepID=A0A1E5WAQ6_9POAL|nr:hypothetical protein BAE44_0004488 [Dichanthelium oligosanthes]